MFAVGFRAPMGAMVASMVLTFGMPVFAETETVQTTSPAEIQKAAEKDPKVCKRFKPTGSNISKTFCFKKSTWDTMREESQRDLRELNDRASVNPGASEGQR